MGLVIQYDRLLYLIGLTEAVPRWWSQQRPKHVVNKQYTICIFHRCTFDSPLHKFKHSCRTLSVTNRQRTSDNSAGFHTLHRTFHRCPDHIQSILFCAALRSTTDIYCVLCTVVWAQEIRLLDSEYAKYHISFQNKLISKMK